MVYDRHASQSKVNNASPTLSFTGTSATMDTLLTYLSFAPSAARLALEENF
jgi:hypothetical protein